MGWIFGGGLLVGLAAGLALAVWIGCRAAEAEGREEAARREELLDSLRATTSGGAHEGGGEEVAS